MGLGTIFYVQVAVYLNSLIEFAGVITGYITIFSTNVAMIRKLFASTMGVSFPGNVIRGVWVAGTFFFSRSLF